jgi:hypothetical protein
MGNNHEKLLQVLYKDSPKEDMIKKIPPSLLGGISN